MGIAAAGNSGTVLANLFAPRLAMSFGWHNVFGLALVPLAIVLALFALLARDAPVRTTHRSRGHYLAAIAHADTRWFCFFYAVTFGGYVGLSSFLPGSSLRRFLVSPLTAGTLTAVAAFAGQSVPPSGVPCRSIGRRASATADPVYDRGGLRRDGGPAVARRCRAIGRAAHGLPGFRQRGGVPTLYRSGFSVKSAA